MVLAGIGGRTIAEAKAAITLREAAVWMAYRRQRGLLNLGLRVEENFAHMQALLESFFTGKAASPDKYMPHVVLKPAAGEEPEADIAAVFGLLKTVAATNNAAPKRPQK